MLLDIKDLREEYSHHALDMDSTHADPMQQFKQWFDEAVQSQVPEPNGMTLSTVAADGQPRGRVVLLKQADARGFVFFTNYLSDKGQELAAEPRAALTFWWMELARQVRIEGVVGKIPAEESTEYFQSRPKGSQIGAWASPQSTPIATREELENRVIALGQQYADEAALPRPEHWGGYVLRPLVIEFWQGRESRLHDRIRYTLAHDGYWQRERLAP
jgi:pyridoxamine 5'-phosphate oxidase